MQSLAIFKALGDESRLAIFRLLLEREAHSEVIAERLKLAPSTVSFHLKKMINAGIISARRDQYYTFFEAVPEIANVKLSELVFEAKLKTLAQDKSEDVYRAKVLKSFFKYGRLVKIPTQKMKRQWVLEKVAESLTEKKSYTKLEAEKILSELFDDTDALLRELRAAQLIAILDGRVTTLHN